MGFGECHVAPVWFQYYEKRYQLIRQNATLNPNPNLNPNPDPCPMCPMCPEELCPAKSRQK